jgi:hypothetical protein
MPQMIKNTRPQAGDAVYARQGQNMLGCFRDHNRQKPVTLVSTCGITNKILIEYDYFFWYIT